MKVVIADVNGAPLGTGNIDRDQLVSWLEKGGTTVIRVDDPYHPVIFYRLEFRPGTNETPIGWGQGWLFNPYHPEEGPDEWVPPLPKFAMEATNATEV